MQDNFDVTNDSLDILTDVLAKFGHLLADQHALILQTLLPYLDDSRQGIRKRALHCIGEGGHAEAVAAGTNVSIGVCKIAGTCNKCLLSSSCRLRSMNIIPSAGSLHLPPALAVS